MKSNPLKSFQQDMKNTIGCLGKKIICSQLNNSWKLVLRQAKTFFRDHKHSLTLLLQQVVKGY